MTEPTAFAALILSGLTITALLINWRDRNKR